MDFEKVQDCVDALKGLEGSPPMGMEVRDGHLFLDSLSRRAELPLRRARGWGDKVVRYGSNKLDTLVDSVKYDDLFRQVRLFDMDNNVIAHVELKSATREEWLLEELYGKRLHSSMNINQYKKYVMLCDGVVFTAEADGLTGVFVNWLAVDSPVSHIIDRGDRVCIVTEAGSAVDLFFKEGDDDEED